MNVRCTGDNFFNSHGNKELLSSKQTHHSSVSLQVAVNYAASSGAAEEVAAAIKAAGGDAMVVGANVAKREDIDRMFKVRGAGWVIVG